MNLCKETQRAIAQTISLDALGEAQIAHAATCPRCGASLARYRQLDQVTRRTRRVLEASGDLAPNDWVRIRTGVDQAVARRRPWLAGALVVATAALAVVAGMTMSQGGQGGDVERASGLALHGVDAPEAPRVALAPPAPTPAPVLAATEGGVALTVAAGDVLEAGETSRTIAAFARHRITLAAGTELRVRDWSATKLALEVVAGEVTCDVDRAADEDVFEVHSGDVTVRVLGTLFSVARDDEGATTVAVTRGRVGVVEGMDAVREVSAGESLTLGGPTTADVDPGESRAPRRGVHRGPRVIQIDVPDQRMGAGAADGWTSSQAFKAIVKAIDDGNCRAAMKALSAAVDASRRAPIPPAEVAKLRARCAATSQP